MTPKKQCLPDIDRLIYIWTHRHHGRACTSSNQTKIPALRRGSRQALPLTKKLFAVNMCWGEKSILFNSVSLGTLTTLQKRSMFRNNWPTQNKLHVLFVCVYVCAQFVFFWNLCLWLCLFLYSVFMLVFNLFLLIFYSIYFDIYFTFPNSCQIFPI